MEHLRHSGRVKMKLIYASEHVTSGTINANATTSLLYVTTQLKSGYCNESLTETNIDTNH